MKNIPYIVAIDCRKPPSGRVAVTSIQSGTEVIEPISRWHLSWIPYMPRKFAYATYLFIAFLPHFSEVLIRLLKFKF